MSTSIQILERDNARIRREALIRSLLHELGRTIKLRLVNDLPGTVGVELEMTDASVRVIGPLVEAVEILEAIIFASDGCAGHRECVHSMEPWQRARALLQGKWDSYENREPWPSSEPK